MKSREQGFVIARKHSSGKLQFMSNDECDCGKFYENVNKATIFEGETEADDAMEPDWGQFIMTVFTERTVLEIRSGKSTTVGEEENEKEEGQPETNN